jgi:hypothetical protein
MHTRFLRDASPFLLLLAASIVIGCGGGTTGPDAAGLPSQSQTPGASSGAHGDDDAPASGTGASETGSTTTGTACPDPATVLVPSGGAITRPPSGSALRLQLVYQGSSIGVTDIRGVDMIIGPSDGPFVAGKVSGYWAETRTATATVYQHLFRDPTVREAPGAPGGGGFTSSTMERCAKKIILVDVPNDASAKELVIFGSPYGTQGAAVELARFTLK